MAPNPPRRKKNRKNPKEDEKEEFLGFAAWILQFLAAAGPRAGEAGARK
jgi:hypothetical protein